MAVKPKTMRQIAAWHRALSLATFAMVLLWCVTGVPLIFHDKLDIALGALPTVRSVGPALPLDRMLEAAHTHWPYGQVQTLQRFHERHDIWAVGMKDASDNWDLLAFREDTGMFVQSVDRRDAFTSTLLVLHRELCSGPTGKWLVFAFGLVWLGSLLTGMVLYGPHMRRLSFGNVRLGPGHINASDWHKLLGAITLVWNVVLAGTGMLLDLGTMISHQRISSVQAHREALDQAVTPTVTPLTLDAARVRAEAALPGYDASIIYVPGSKVAGDHHAVFLMSPSHVGPVRPRLPVVVDRYTGAATQVALPWWASSVDLMAAIHFGRGTLVYQVVWSLFALATVGLGITGLTVFALRYKSRRVTHVVRDEGLVRC